MDHRPTSALCGVVSLRKWHTWGLGVVSPSHTLLAAPSNSDQLTCKRLLGAALLLLIQAKNERKYKFRSIVHSLQD